MTATPVDDRRHRACGEPVVRDGVFWRRHPLYLRTHPEAASAYFELKERLASRCRTDRVANTDGKSAFVESALAKAAADEGA